jgi:hypothetical protein
MKIIKLESSPLKNKRFRVLLDNGDSYDFGLKDGSTYIDHHDKILRDNYRKRHLANKIENKLISNIIPSPSLFSMYLLWGDYTNIYDNIKMLNKLFSKL